MRLDAEGFSAVLACPPGLHPAPGQYLTASSADPTEAMPVLLYPLSLPGEALTVAPPLPRHWVTGERLILRGPLGKGFQLPREALRVALCAYQCSPALLVSLARQAVDQGAAVVLCAQRIHSGLPDAVEILPLDSLPETLAWCDFLAGALPPRALPAFRGAAKLQIHQRFPPGAQALLTAPMPCAGMGACGACAVLTNQGWAQACSDGPVFDLNSLENP